MASFPGLHHKPGQDGTVAFFLALASLLLLVSLLVGEGMHRVRPAFLTATGALILTGVLFNAAFGLCHDVVNVATSSTVLSLLGPSTVPQPLNQHRVSVRPSTDPTCPC